MDLNTDYFRNLVTTETFKLNQLCDKWTNIMNNESDIPEEGFGQIRSTIGQTNLFINQRFKQFNGLIDDCELKRGLKETKVEDLSGFWDMIYFQIIELHNKFDALLTLKSNNWVETQTEPKLIKQIKKKMVSKSETSVKPLVKSSLRAQIQSLKNKKVVQSKDQNESIGEKENFKIKCSIDSAKGNDSSKMIASNKKLLEIQESNEMRSVLKRTPLLKK